VTFCHRANCAPSGRLVTAAAAAAAAASVCPEDEKRCSTAEASSGDCWRLEAGQAQMRLTVAAAQDAAAAAAVGTNAHYAAPLSLHISLLPHPRHGDALIHQMITIS